MYRYLIVLYLIFVSLSVQSVEVKDLYLAKVAVTSQSQNARDQAIKEAFKTVLVKVGGKPSILNEPFIKRSLAQYKQFLVAYRYEKTTNQLDLVVTFDEQKVNDLFMQGEIPIWGSLRPQVVVWLLFEEGLERKVMADNEAHVIIDTVKTFSANRGLPMVMPLMDLTDSQQISMPDLWGRFYSPIYYASQRYQAENIVVVRIVDETSHNPAASDSLLTCEPLCKKSYQLDWQFIMEEGAETVGNQYQGSALPVLMEQALSDLTEVIYQDYAINVSAEQTLLVDIVDANSLTETKKVSEYLANLSVVQSVTLVNVAERVRQFELKLRGTKAAFIASLALDNALQQRLDPLAPENPDAIPVLYWSQP
ncbi:DUF2066 domain-containing protein [Thalassotalea fusca]